MLHSCPHDLRSLLPNQPAKQRQEPPLLEWSHKTTDTMRNNAHFSKLAALVNNGHCRQVSHQTRGSSSKQTTTLLKLPHWASIATRTGQGENILAWSMKKGTGRPKKSIEPRL
ncbi:Os04g0193250 [Oryza sativa Japonica Group]|uniref:Os04g0193250 protein n=1 Tax=Oryza sativa subsp. japonica TaxID=39947 RepID=A0A0P0W7A0_ORYSJ|nr:Os04g0193250 [Oryza sativa Japonica Group]